MNFRKDSMKALEKQSEKHKNTTESLQINTVLIIDDDDNWCYLTKVLLEDVVIGKQILTAYNGEDAIKILQNILSNGGNLPELILLDLNMPVMNGFEFLEAITQTESWDLSSTKIYICTSSILSNDKEKSKLYPVAGFITKPYSDEILKDIIDQY